jgi:myo-inositol-1(or 4)-monophosphatase
MALSANINVMLKAAEKAAKSLLRDFGEVENLQVSRKGPGDFVSAADLRSEKIIHEELKKARPDFGFLMEESGKADSKGNEESRWIVDPLDGTTNFLHGIPHWNITIALEQKGEIIAGIIFDPVKNEMFRAEKGGGAFLRNQRLRVSNRTALADSILATGIPTQGEAARSGGALFMRQIGTLMPQVSGVRRMGAAALDMAYVAAGRYEAYWENAIKPWDIAAGTLIVREAGGFATEIGGGDNPIYQGNVLAANSHLHTDLKKLLQSVSRESNAA